MKYFKNENNQIFAYDNEQISQGYGKELVQITEEEMLAITNPPKTSEEAETIRIEQINSKAGEIITAKYPLYKQNNITLLLTPYTEIDKEEMCMFIDTVRGIAKTAKDNGTSFEDINWSDLDK